MKPVVHHYSLYEMTLDLDSMHNVLTNHIEIHDFNGHYLVDEQNLCLIEFLYEIDLDNHNMLIMKC